MSRAKASQLYNKEKEKDKENEYAKLPLIQEIKVVFINFGALTHDILVENHTNYKRYIHIFKFPY
jgi:hypothetical protein